MRNGIRALEMSYGDYEERTMKNNYSQKPSWLIMLTNIVILVFMCVETLSYIQNHDRT